MLREPTARERAYLKRKIRLAHAIDRYARTQFRLVIGFDRLHNLADVLADEVAALADAPDSSSYILERVAKPKT